MSLALLAAVGAAVGYGVASILQAVAARRSSGLTLLRQPLVLLGFVLDGAAWLSSMVALQSLPLFVVQSVQASSLVIVVLLAAFVLKVRPRPIDLAAVGAIIAALGVLALAGGDQPAEPVSTLFTTCMITVSVLLVAGAVAAYRKGPSWLLAVFGGLGYGGVAVAARGADTHGHLSEIVFQPLAIPVALCAAVGIVCFLMSLERGSVAMASAILSVVEVVIPTIVGITVLGDHIRDGWALGATTAILVALGGCVILAASPANEAAG